MTEERRRWTDERLDDAFKNLERQMRTDIGNIADDMAEVKMLVVQLSKNLADTAAAMAHQELKQERAKSDERAELALERKSDRRWLLGTIFTLLALIMTAVSVLVATGAF